MKKNNDFFGFSEMASGSNDNRVVWVVNFEEIDLKRFYENFIRLEEDPHTEVIPVMVSSYGGSCDVLTAMRDLIRSSQKPVATIAVGKAMSCGLALVAAGTKGMRFGSASTRFMIHEIAGGAVGKNEEIQTTALEMAQLNKVMMGGIAEDMGKSYDWLMAQLAKRKNNDWFLSSAEAKKLKIIDHIGIPRSAALQSKTILHIPVSYSDQSEAIKAATQTAKPRKK